MEKDYKDFHIDQRLEKLFHADDLQFNSESEGGDDIMAGSLPEWLIGVIVVIILLIIAFFIMVISTIIKNKRKSQSASTSDLSSSTHICDDLELGKIRMIDPRQQETCAESEETMKSDSVSRSPNSPPEPCCSTTGDDSPMCTYKNPLYVDDELDRETDHELNCNSKGHTNIESPITNTCNSKSKGKSNKHKSSRSVACNDLNSVQELQEEEKENLEEDCTQPTERIDIDSICKSPVQQDVNSISNTDCNTDEVFVHVPCETTNGFQSETISHSQDDSHSEERAAACNEGDANNGDVGEENVGIEDFQSSDENNVPEEGSSRVQGAVPECDTDDTKLVDKENNEPTKNQRFSFIRMTLDEESSEIENNERTYTKL